MSMEEKKLTSARIDMVDKKSKKMADDHREEKQKEALKLLIETESFVLVSVNGVDGCAISAIDSKHSVAIVKMLGAITKQILNQTMKSGNVLVIMDMIAMMQRERDKESNQG